MSHKNNAMVPHLIKRCQPELGSSLILIGMPGSGKTTMGRIISRKTGLAWVDTDYLLESWWGMPLQAVRDRLGLDGFLKAEEELVESMNFFRTIISTGGSVVYSVRAMKRLEELGRIVYLKADLETIQQRLQNTSTRGLAIKPGQSMADVFLERRPLYKRYARLTIDTDLAGPEQNADKIIKWLER
ncbi:homoserine kinase [Desulfonatronovibrio hydrogenovorans]|uniref:homoserine kinase n=1 Tax=Desulfonatronovibrio hydrogenovorans TaxID=53245 RepID=UPI0009FE7FF9|nr:homoserine kinase [Desulfonatronovibrio hydrogenovorans]